MICSSSQSSVSQQTWRLWLANGRLYLYSWSLSTWQRTLSSKRWWMPTSHEPLLLPYTRWEIYVTILTNPWLLVEGSFDVRPVPVCSLMIKENFWEDITNSYWRLKRRKNLVTIVVETFDSSYDASSLGIACVAYALVCSVKRFWMFVKKMR